MNNAISYKCPSCDGLLDYDSNSKHLVCAFCGRDCDDVLVEKASQFNNEQSFTGYDCSSCGAKIIADKNTISTNCIFCGAQVFTKDISEHYQTPDYVIPFVLDKERAIKEYKHFCVSHNISAKGLASDDIINGITSIYVPVWLYTTEDTEVYMVVEGIVDGLFKNERTKTSADDSFFHIEMNGNLSFKDLPVSAKSNIDYKYIEGIEPYDYNKIVPYHPKYILGHYADRNDLKKDEAHSRAIDRMVKTTTKLFEGAVVGKYDSKHVLKDSVYHDFKPENVKSVLVPVWFLFTEFNGKNYYYTINGQTGKVAGTLKKSDAKVWYNRSVIFILAVAFATLFGYLVARSLGAIIASIAVGCYIIKHNAFTSDELDLIDLKHKADEYFVNNSFKVNHQSSKFIGKRREIEKRNKRRYV